MKTSACSIGSIFLLVCLFVPEQGLAEYSGEFVELPSTSLSLSAEDTVVWSFVDSNNDLDVFAVWKQFDSGNFNRSKGGGIWHEENRKNLWTIVPIEIEENDQSEWFVWVDGAPPNDIEMWLLDGELNVVEHHLTGSAHKYFTRPVSERVFGIPIELRVKEKVFVVFRMSLVGSSFLNLKIDSMESLISFVSKDALVKSCYLGLGTMMFFYSFFLFWITKRQAFLSYGIYVCCLLVAGLGGSEIFHRYLWPEAAVGNVRITFVTSFMTGFIACHFIADLLDIKNRWVTLWRVLQLCMGISLVGALLAMVIDIQTIVRLSSIWGGGLAGLLVLVCGVSAYRGSFVGGILSCGWLAQLVGIALLVSHIRGWQPDVFWLDYAFLIGSSLEMLFFSLAIPLGLLELMTDKVQLIDDLSDVSQKYEEGLESAAKVDLEITSLKTLLEQEHHDLERLTLGYERAYLSLKKADQKLAQAEKLASLGQLIVGVSDDLGIKAVSVMEASKDLDGYLGRLIKSDSSIDELPDKDVEKLREATSNIRRLIGFVEKGALSIQRMNKALSHYSGGENEAISEFELAEIFEDTRLIVHGRIFQHTLEVTIDEGLCLKARRSQVERVLGNLMTNAADALHDLSAVSEATEEGGIIRVRAEQVNKAGSEWVLIEVEDSGGGIAIEDRSEVLLPFMTTKSLHRGTGLGLFTADAILREHGGSLEIGSSDGLSGAKISLWFPVLN